MDPQHARRHLDELHATAAWLRTATPDGPRYKLWLGDLVEFTRVAFGLDSPQMARVREVLTGSRLPPDAGETDRVRDYLARLDRLTALIDDFARNFPDPLALVDPTTNGPEPP